MVYNWSINKTMLKRIGLALAAVTLFSSCGIVPMISEPIPVSESMLYTVDFKDMKLQPADYEVLDVVEASARINVVNRYLDGKLVSSVIEDPDGQFSIAKSNWVVYDGKEGPAMTVNKGVLRAGYLSGWGSVNESNPSEVSVRLATYRLIQLVREQGGDYVIQPIYTTNVESRTEELGKEATTTRTYRTIVSGKAIRLKTTGR